ncbi:hypothetical protein LCM4573_25450 [Rhizobium sp. LCM 4573]|nr:hypothetical protein LCM4573_25450 [Rhizobium sp. LCM 4573]
MMALYFILVTIGWGYTELFNGRAAFSHLGAFTATIMSANSSRVTRHIFSKTRPASMGERAQYGSAGNPSAKRRTTAGRRGNRRTTAMMTLQQQLPGGNFLTLSLQLPTKNQNLRRREEWPGRHIPHRTRLSNEGTRDDNAPKEQRFSCGA